ncbi:PREDICTED: peritrophin-48 [Rhagoletis zephyria]|uniref:peritrophin-48 n=1 Tax=Rhagoletis zephyria TaxID=28612 RepID=UPI00081135BD|nr:PREDICTED: peritrophin-48 [Rhagoletis zephyria]
MTVKNLACSLTVLLILFTNRSRASVSDDICHFFPNETTVRDPNSCSQYITCINSVSHYTACSSSTPYFDKDTGKCVKTLSDYSNCGVFCEDSVGQFIDDPTSCNGYYYCNDATTPIRGTCPDNTHFNSTLQACVYKTDSQCKLKELDVCAIAKNGVKVASDTDCRKYYECKKGVLSESQCGRGLYYNALSGTCLAKWRVNCAKHPLPDNVCGTTKNPYINQFVSDDATCRGYYYCNDKIVPDPAPKWGQCSNGTFFDAKTETCANPLTVACPSGADRCEGRSLTFVSGSEKGCRQYLRCQDGKTEAELSCGNRFFDENLVACISSPITYQSCAS